MACGKSGATTEPLRKDNNSKPFTQAMSAVSGSLRVQYGAGFGLDKLTATG